MIENFLLTLLLSVILVRVMIKLCHRWDILDRPNHRSSHQTPTALMGGIGFIMAFFISVVLGPSNTLLTILSLDQVLWLTTSLLLVAVISMIDDIYTLNAKKRFLCHGASAAMVVVAGFSVNGILLPGFWIPFLILAPILTVFYLMSWVNIYNFLDGIDGYAAGMGGIGGTFMLVFFLNNAMWTDAGILLTMIAALLGFWVWNRPKAKIFMGDIGSAFLGLFFGIISLRMLQVDGTSILLPMLIFSTFLMDGTVTLVQRYLKGENLSEAHRDHYYQKLIRSGWSHGKVLKLEYSWMLFTGVLSLIYAPASHSVQWAVIVIVILSFALKYRWINRKFQQAA